MLFRDGTGRDDHKRQTSGSRQGWLTKTMDIWHSQGIVEYVRQFIWQVVKNTTTHLQHVLRKEHEQIKTKRASQPMGFNKSVQRAEARLHTLYNKTRHRIIDREIKLYLPVQKICPEERSDPRRRCGGERRGRGIERKKQDKYTWTLCDGHWSLQHAMEG